MTTMNTWTVGTTSTTPSQPPRGLISTNAVNVKAGWVGQVLVDREVVLESRPFRTSERAGKWANDLVVRRVRALFEDPDQDD